MKIVRSPRRLALSTLAAAALALGATGCAYFNETQTHDFYQAADGVNINPTGVGVRNAILVVDDQGTGHLYTTAVNDTTEDASAHLVGTVDGSTVLDAQVPVPAGETVQIGGEGNQQVTVADLGVDPGGMMELTVSAPGQEDASSPLPVTDTSLEYYQGVGGSDGGQG